MATIDRIRELIAPIIDAEEVELYDLEYNGGILRVFVDDPERVLGDTNTGIDISVVRRISRSISHMLDEVDPISGRYTLEVSSPGLERALRTPDHYRKAMGSVVKIKTNPNVDGDRRATGELVAFDDDGFELSIDGETRRFAYGDIANSRTVFEWGPTPKKGGPKNPEKIPEKKAPTS